MVHYFIRQVHFRFNDSKGRLESHCISTKFEIMFDASNMLLITINGTLRYGIEIQLEGVDEAPLTRFCADFDTVLPVSMCVLLDSVRFKLVVDVTYCLAISPPIHSPSGRGRVGSRRASIMMSACLRTPCASVTSEYSSNRKNRFIKSQPTRQPSRIQHQLA